MFSYNLFNQPLIKVSDLLLFLWTMARPPSPVETLFVALHKKIFHNWFPRTFLNVPRVQNSRLDTVYILKRILMELPYLVLPTPTMAYLHIFWLVSHLRNQRVILSYHITLESAWKKWIIQLLLEFFLCGILQSVPLVNFRYKMLYRMHNHLDKSSHLKVLFLLSWTLPS